MDSKKIGYVSQECFLLNDTIRKNIAFGESEDLIDDKKIDDVISKVNLSDFVNKYPEKKIIKLQIMAPIYRLVKNKLVSQELYISNQI